VNKASIFKEFKQQQMDQDQNQNKLIQAKMKCLTNLMDF
jgi:hypothetical protein